MITYIKFFLEQKSGWTSSSSHVLLAAPWAPRVFTVPCLMSLRIYFPYFCFKKNFQKFTTVYKLWRYLLAFEVESKFL